MIVGRDTRDMNQTDVARACIESVSENIVDGVTAPLFWVIIGPAILSAYGFDVLLSALFCGYFYKSVNTMDSMLGYKNERYRQFGYVAAKLDDLVNFIPSRISGICVVTAALLLGYNYKQSYIILHRDRLKTSSPNSGHTEAAFSGALGVKLGGAASYDGMTIEKPYIGKTFGDPCHSDILKANKLAVMTVACFIVLMFFFYLIIEQVLR